MKAIYLDAFSGISGNMLLGAFLQAGVPEGYLRQELAKRPRAGEFELSCTPVTKQGVRAAYVDVRLMSETAHGETQEAQAHAHVHRTLADIEALLSEALLSEAVKEKARAVFRLLAQEEIIRRARVIIAIAGMEGALASVVGGMAQAPVIAVPTSVGYGASFSGVTALLSMLSSCAAGVSVVNIDNGFGAGVLASKINALS